MSELTLCNHCTLTHLKYQARQNGLKVSILRGEKDDALGRGWDVFVHPKEVINPRQDQYWSCWFMELTDECVC
jgi:hypothetical protein